MLLPKIFSSSLVQPLYDYAGFFFFSFGILVVDIPSFAANIIYLFINI